MTKWYEKETGNDIAMDPMDDYMRHGLVRRFSDHIVRPKNISLVGPSQPEHKTGTKQGCPHRNPSNNHAPRWTYTLGHYDITSICVQMQLLAATAPTYAVSCELLKRCNASTSMPPRHTVTVYRASDYK